MTNWKFSQTLGKLVEDGEGSGILLQGFWVGETERGGGVQSLSFLPFPNIWFQLPFSTLSFPRLTSLESISHSSFHWKILQGLYNLPPLSFILLIVLCFLLSAYRKNKRKFCVFLLFLRWLWFLESQKDENNDGIGETESFWYQLGISVLFICFLNTEMM